MAHQSRFRTALKWLAAALGLAAGAYGSDVGVTWLRYGQATTTAPEDVDALLDRFVPVYDVSERHRIEVAAPADVTFATACEQDLMGVPVVRAIFKARELVLGAEPDAATRPRGLLAMTRSIGWGELAQVPGREIVMGAVTQPWLANVVFRPLPAADFRTFDQPDFVKIVWTLRADPVDAGHSIFRTETRVQTTDASARAKFRWYWARFSPGIALIRRLSLGPVRREAERRGLSGLSPIAQRSECESTIVTP